MNNVADITRLFFEKVYNQRDFTFIDTMFATDYYEHTETGARSNSDCKNIINGACVSFPDLSVVVNHIIVDGDFSAARVTFKGTHRSEFLGIQPQNKSVEFEAMEFFKFKDGKISESWGNWPLYSILEQIK